MAPTPSPRGSPSAVQDRLVGRVLGGRYRVRSRLGEGGMGTVYLCEHAVLGRRYAVKVLRPELGGDAELAERFRNEAIAARRTGGGTAGGRLHSPRGRGRGRRSVRPRGSARLPRTSRSPAMVTAPVTVRDGSKKKPRSLGRSERGTDGDPYGT